MNDQLKRLVRNRAGNACEYCGIPQALIKFRHQFDHIIAEKHGGQPHSSNLALACMLCNLHKGSNIAGIDPVTQQHSRLFHPRRNSWKAHFVWNGFILEGKTAIGRATAHVIKINHSKRVNLRNLYYSALLFPWPMISRK